MTRTAGERLADILDLDGITQLAIDQVSAQEQVSKAVFRSMLARGRVVLRPAGLADPFSYAPWFGGTFQLAGQPHRFLCFFGKRCVITLPTGERIYFEVQES